jgi:hypothetical protein
MNFLLAPAIFVMNRMRFGAKFAFILIGFVFTTGLLLGVLVTDRISAYRVEQRELRGAQVLPDFYALIMSLQQHRGMSAAALAGDAAMASKLPAKRAEVEAAFKALESVVAEAGRHRSSGRTRDAEGRVERTGRRQVRRGGVVRAPHAARHRCTESDVPRRAMRSR